MSEIDVRGAMTLINSELQSLESMLTGYAELVSEVRWAQRNTPSEVKEFTVQQRAKLVDCLTAAEAGFRTEIVTVADIKIKLIRVLGILQKAAAYVEPARAAVVTGSSEDEEGEVLETEVIDSKWGPVRKEIRKFAADHPDGEYQEWIDGRFKRTVAHEVRMSATAQMRALLGRLDALNESV